MLRTSPRFWRWPCPLRSATRAVFACPHSPVATLHRANHHTRSLCLLFPITPHVPPLSHLIPPPHPLTPLPHLASIRKRSSQAVGLLRDGEVAKVYILDTDGLSISKFITLATLCRFLLKLVQHTDLPADRTLKQMSIGLKPVRVHPPRVAPTVWLKGPRPRPPRTLLLVSLML